MSMPCRRVDRIRRLARRLMHAERMTVSMRMALDADMRRFRTAVIKTIS
jgi:hypothetical protein